MDCCDIWVATHGAAHRDGCPGAIPEINRLRAEVERLRNETACDFCLEVSKLRGHDSAAELSRFATRVAELEATNADLLGTLEMRMKQREYNKDATIERLRTALLPLAQLFCDKETPARRWDGPSRGCGCDVCGARRALAAKEDS